MENLQAFLQASGKKTCFGIKQILALQLTHCATHVTLCLSYFTFKTRFYLHELGLDLAVHSGFEKRPSTSIMENSRGWQPRICEAVVLINKVLRGSRWLLEFQPSCLYSSFGHMSDIPKGKKIQKRVQRRFQGTSM